MRKHQVLLTCMLLSIASPSLSQPDPILQLIDILKENGSLTAQQHTVLETALKDRQQDQPSPEQYPEDDNQTIVNTKGGIEVSTMDGEFSAKLGGTLMVDYAHYRQDKNDLGDGTELRKAKLSLEGRLFGDWEYELEVDFGGADVDIDDAYLAYIGQYPWKFTVGQFKEQFSMEELTSSRHITFMERALPNEIAPGRSIGLGAHYLGENWTFATGIFGEEFDSDHNKGEDEGWGFTTRVTYAPYASDNQALHFGMAASIREPDTEQRFRLDTRPESHITGIKFLDTGKKNIEDVEQIQKYGFEVAWVEGPFSLQGEWLHASISRDGDHDLNFSGWYGQASWFLTGESRKYKFNKGAFGRITPKNSYGAFELAGRISELDLNDLDIEGGQAKQITIGLNWYINEHMKLMANYIKVDHDDKADADGDVTGNDDPDIFQMRFQADF